MDKNTVKMMLALGEGEPVEVGRCHPGKARLLCKQGLAEWRDGKVWLKAPVAQAVSEDGDPLRDYSDMSLGPVPEHLEMYARAAASARKHLREYREEVLVQKPPPFQHAEQVSSVTALLGLFLEAREMGHNTFAFDDGRSARSGFVDRDIRMGGTFFGVPEWMLDHLDDLTDADARRFKLETVLDLQAALATVPGREALFGQAAPQPVEVTRLGVPKTMPRVDAVEAEIDGMVDDGLLSDIWGPSPLLPKEGGPTVGERSHLRVRRDGTTTPEEYKARAKDLREQYGAKPIQKFRGWASFRWPGCEEAIPVWKDDKPHPPQNWLEGKRPEAAYGFFRRVGDRLYRVWTYGSEVWWDESVMDQDEYTYHLVDEVREPGLTLAGAIEAASGRIALIGRGKVA